MKNLSNDFNVSFEPKKPENSIHFGFLGNGVTVYDISRTDPKTHDYPIVAHISPEGVVKIYDNTISAEDRELINKHAHLEREKFLLYWSLLTPGEQYEELLDRVNHATFINIIHNPEALPMEQAIKKYMPFVFLGEGERPKGYVLSREFEDINGDRTLVTVDGDSEQECVEHLADMQTEKEDCPYYRLVMYSEISTDSWS